MFQLVAGLLSMPQLCCLKSRAVGVTKCGTLHLVTFVTQQDEIPARESGNAAAVHSDLGEIYHRI